MQAVNVPKGRFCGPAEKERRKSAAGRGRMIPWKRNGALILFLHLGLENALSVCYNKTGETEMPAMPAENKGESTVQYVFKEAVPVWEKGLEKEKNLTLIFRALAQRSISARLALTCSSAYQLFVNGEFVAAGPAKAAHNVYKVDEIELCTYLDKKQNVITVYVAGYNVNSFHLLNQPAFLCAELVCDGVVTAATGKAGFTAARYTERVQRVQRYSYQRPFTEVYRIGADHRRIDLEPDFAFEPVALAAQPPKRCIARDVYYAAYETLPAETAILRGTVRRAEEVLRPFEDRSLVACAGDFGFERSALEVESTAEAGRLAYTVTDRRAQTQTVMDMADGEFRVLDLGVNSTGLLSFELECRQDTALYVTFDEVLTDGFVDFRRFGGGEVANVVIWYCKAGTYRLTAFAPYTLRYLCIANIGGAARLRRLHLKTVGFPKIDAPLQLANPNLQKIYAAAVHTFRQCVLDVYMDCPSRERAGWLCDSFFAARTEYALTGKSVVERAFLNNFLMIEPGALPYLNGTMLPAVYPADYPTADRNNILTWPLWFILQVEEYVQRSKDAAFAEQAREKIYGVLQFLKAYENADGLLENPEGSLFIEWSHANELTQDVNFPANMLYARAKRAAAGLYGDAALAEESRRMNRKICALSYFDGFFHDRGLRQKDGSLRVTEEITETCQYYAFFMETTTPQAYPELWNRLLTDFGPERKANNKWEQVYFSNAFMGNYMRLDLLAKYDLKAQVLREIEGFYLQMAETTGTLWEHDSTHASCCHGFATHVILWLQKFAG